MCKVDGFLRMWCDKSFYFRGSDAQQNVSGGNIMLKQRADCDVTSTGRHFLQILLICLVFHPALTSLPVKLSLTSPLSALPPLFLVQINKNRCMGIQIRAAFWMVASLKQKVLYVKGPQPATSPSPVTCSRLWLKQTEVD